jgi:hypothetical protein
MSVIDLQLFSPLYTTDKSVYVASRCRMHFCTNTAIEEISNSLISSDNRVSQIMVSYTSNQMDKDTSVGSISVESNAPFQDS